MLNDIQYVKMILDYNICITIKRSVYLDVHFMRIIGKQRLWIKKDIHCLLIPTATICTRLQSKFGQKYFVAVYAPETYPIILRFLGLLQHPFFQPFPRFRNYKKHNNTYKHIVLLRRIINYIWNNMKGNIKRIGYT